VKFGGKAVRILFGVRCLLSSIEGAHVSIGQQDLPRQGVFCFYLQGRHRARLPDVYYVGKGVLFFTCMGGIATVCLVYIIWEVSTWEGSLC
jgi:hypothetical protein